jgi:hypothetical protein
VLQSSLRSHADPPTRFPWRLLLTGEDSIFASDGSD